MPTIRSEFEQDTNVFYVTSHGYAADHWFGWLPKALNAHPEIFALLAHEGSRPKYIKTRTSGERPSLIPFTEFLNDMGMTYQAIGDCYSYRAHMMPEVIAEYGTSVPVVNMVRHPYVWLEFYVRWRAGNMRMRSGAGDPLEREWKTAAHKLFEKLSLRKYDKSEVAVWASFQGMVMLNEIVADVESGLPQMKLEKVATDPNVFQGLVRYLTKERCEFSPELLDLVYGWIDTPFRGEEKLHLVTDELYDQWPDWKKAAFPKLVNPKTLEIYNNLGYRL